MNLPPTHSLDGGAEGTRVLHENRPVYRPLPRGDQGPLEHERRKVALFARKATKRQIERIAWLDYDAQNAETREDRLRYLGELAKEFRGEPSEATGDAA